MSAKPTTSQHQHTPPASVRGTLLASDFTSSLDVDRRMFREDIAASIAHARMLGATEIIAQSEADLIIDGLGTIRQEIESGRFEWHPELEDIHMNVEARLFEIVGDVAGKLHTARSRNDQVATDFRVYAKRRADDAIAGCRRIQRALLDQADQHRATLMPGYTHLQRAQPVVFGHVMMAYYEMLDRDVASFKAARSTADSSPLGSGALAGTTYPIDRDQTAHELGFSSVARNSIDAVSDRDFALDWVFAASKTMIHLSRLAEDIVIWSSQEFGFVSPSESYSTGSSMMPQKRNPDYAELIRGKSGQVTGALVSLLMTLKGLPMTYNRDLQEDKRQLMDAADTVSASLEAAAGMVSEMRVNSERTAEAAASPELLATDVADKMVREQGTTFREAYVKVKESMLEPAWESAPRDQTPDEASDDFTALDSVTMRDGYGGTAPDRVSEAVMRAYGDLWTAKLRREW